MKKTYLFLLALVLMPLSIGAQNGFVVRLQESFETGQIPSTWTQEYVVGHQDWAVEELSDYRHPNAQLPDYKLDKGGTHRAYLRNTTGQTIGFKTRLVSPVMDLTDVYRPILRFYHAQDKWTADFDTLRVYYRANPEDDWTLLPEAEYNKAYSGWQAETIELPSFNSKTYQIAFEGTDNLGRGIVLDSIVVRSYPECTRPSDITMTGVGNGEATVSWHANWDADEFHIVFSKEQAEMDTLGLIDPAVIAVDTIVPYDGVFRMTAVGLQANTKYYVYMQSICGGQLSEWSDPQEFTMAYREQIPYHEDFFMIHTSNQVSDMRLPSWTWGGAIPPLLGLWMGQTYYPIYSHTDPATPAAVFNGTYSVTSGRFTTPLPANTLAYMASPELVGEDIKDCQVRFWATVAQRAFQRTYATSIIVGIATDPTDFTTMVAVDTVKITKKDVIEEYTVSLANYTGNGRFLVFASYFDKPNQFYIDEVTIEKRPDRQKPDYQTFFVYPKSKEATIEWAAPAADVQSYNVVVAKDIVVSGTTIDATESLPQSNVATAKATINGLQPSTIYKVAVQAVYASGVSAWSEPREVWTSAERELPMTFNFEADEGMYNLNGVGNVFYPAGMQVYSTDVDAPYIYANTSSISAQSGTQMIYLNMDAGNESRLVLPYIEEVDSVQLTFYLSSQTAANVARCRIQVGVMTDPSQMSTFEYIDEFYASESWRRCYTNFLDYKGDGHYIVLRWMEPDGAQYSTNYVDNLTVNKVVDCPVTTGITVEESESSAIIRWSKGAAVKWNVKVFSKYVDDADMTVDSQIPGDILDVTLDTNYVVLEGLKYATRYYVYVQAYCDNEPTEWSSAATFLTECPSAMPIPFHTDFEEIEASGTGVLPPCWTPTYLTDTKSYPYIRNVTTTQYNEGGTNLRDMYMYSTTAYGSIISLPKMAGNLKDLLVRGKMTYSSVGYRLYVGVMTEPGNYETLVPVDSVVLITASTTTAPYWQNFSFGFGDYEGPDGYITLYTYNGRANYMYVDDISVVENKYLATGLKQTASDANSITVEWNGNLDADDANSMWVYMLTKELVANPEQYAEYIVRDSTRNNSVKFDNLEQQSNYYLYVRSNGPIQEWAHQQVSTACVTIDPMARTVFDFEGYPLTTSATSAFAQGPNCWTVGNLEPYTNNTYMPFIYGSATSSYPSSGNCCLRLYGSATYNPAYAIMPMMAADNFDDITLKFYACSSTANYTLVVGVVENPDDELKSFVTVDSIPLTTTPTRYEIDMSKYKGTGKYVAFRTPYKKLSYAYIDDVMLDGVPCYMPNATVTRVTTSSARLTAGLRAQTKWVYYLSSAAPTQEILAGGVSEVDGKTVFTLDNSIEVLKSDTLEASTRLVVLTGLESNVEYTASVASLCDETEGILSEWKIVSFYTMCPPVPAAFYDGFEDYETGSGKKVGCWITGNLTEGVGKANIPYVNNTATYRTEGDKYMYLATTAATPGAYAITPQLDTDDISKLQVKFHARTGTTSSYAKKLKVGVITDPREPSTMVILDTINVLSTPGRHVVAFNNYIGDLNGDKGKHIIFLSEFAQANYVGIDEVTVEPIPDCMMPNGLSLDSIGAGAAKMHWNGNTDKYRVVLTTESVADTVLNKIPFKGEIEYVFVDTIVTGKALSLDGLQGATTYYVHLAPICKDGEQGDFTYNEYMFSTDCHEVFPLPITFNFDHQAVTGAGNGVDCFGGYYNSTSTTSPYNYPYVYTTASFAHSPNYSVYLYATTDPQRSILVSPRLDIDDLSELLLTFWARSGTANRQLGIGVLKDDNVPDSAFMSNYVELTSIDFPAASVYQEIQIDFSSLPKIENYKGAKRIAFVCSQGSAYSTFYLDDITFSRVPNCFIPTQLTIDETDYNGMTVSFLPGKEKDTKWQLKVSNLTDPNEAELIIDIDTTTYVVTGLKPSTMYAVSVRTLCGSDKSEWSVPSSAYTKFEIAGTYKWTFRRSEGFVRNTPSATSDTYIIHPALEGGSTNSSYSYVPYMQFNSSTLQYGYDPDYDAGNDEVTDGSLRFYGYTTYSPWVVLPRIINGEQKSLAFDMRGSYNYVADHATANLRNTFGTVYARPRLSIGTIVEGQGIETYEELYSFTPTDLTANSVDTMYALPSNNYLFDHVSVPLPDLTGKRVVIRSMLTGATNYAFIDNLEIKAREEASAVIKSAVAYPHSVKVTWNDRENGAWDLFLLDKALHPTDSVGHLVRRVENLKGNTYTFDGLEAVTPYWIYLQPAGSTDISELSPRVKIQTICTSTDSTAVYDFEAIGGHWYGPGTTTKNLLDGENFTYLLPNSTTVGDSVYKAPNCWQLGLASYEINSTYKTYWPYMRKNETSTRYSLEGDYALQFYTTSTYANGAFAVLPLSDIKDMDDKELVFYGRCFWENATARPANLTYIKGTTYSQLMEVGVVGNPLDFSGTFMPLDTVEYDLTTADLSTSTSMLTDAEGARFFKKFVVPLKGVEPGSMIAMRQLGYGYFFVDNVTIQKRQTAIAPTHLQATSTHETIHASWLGKQEGGRYEVVLSSSKDFADTLRVDTVSVNEIEYTGMTADFDYYWTVRQIETAYGDSKPAHFELISTECTPAAAGYSTSFEYGDGSAVRNFYSSGTTIYPRSRCWVYGNEGTTTTLSSSQPCNYGSSSAVSYALDGEWALRLYTYSTTFNSYAVSPRIDVDDMSDMQFTFWFTPCPHGINTSANRDKVSTAWAAGNAAMVEVGTCTDPYDYSTFVPTDTIRYTRSTQPEMIVGTVADITNDYTFQKVTVPLENAVGPYAYIRAIYEGASNGTTTCTQSSVYIDRVSVESVVRCDSPVGLTQVEDDDESMVVTWQEVATAQGYILQMSQDFTFPDSTLIAVDTLKTNFDTIYGLHGSNEYYVRVSQICEGGNSDWSQTETFRSAEVPMFHQNFSDDRARVDGWRFYRALANNVFDTDEYAWTEVASTGANTGWARVQNVGLSGYHYAARTYLSNANFWMVSPTVILPDTADAMLSFAISYSEYKAYSSTSAYNFPITHADNGLSGYDDQFMVIVSEDAGKTWKRENAIIWNNETGTDPLSEGYFYGPGDYVLNEVPFQGSRSYTEGSAEGVERFTLKLDKYRGKAIKVAFYMESTVSNADNEMHIDDYHINFYEKVNDEVTLCQYEDYNSSIRDIFFVDGDVTVPGANTMSDYVLSMTAKDTLFTLTYNVLEAPVTDLGSATICEGEIFTTFGTQPLTAAGNYKIKSVSEVTGCDSITTFSLNVIPRQKGQMEETICQGSKFTWQTGKGAVELDRAGVYFDTIPSLVTGCDSVITFVLNVSAPDTIEVEAEVAENELPYEYNGMLLGEGLTVGEYEIEAPITDENGCIVVVRLTLTVTEPTIEALDNLVAGELSITPSVISRGETVTVSGELSSRQMRDMRLDVFDATGKCVYSTEPKTLPAKADGFVSAGIYSVRLTTGSGESYVGRVLVK